MLAKARAGGGYVLDGFPRTPDQARRLDDDDVAVYLALPDEVARQRIAARGEGRADDAAPEVVDRRLRVYHEETAPLLDLYRKRGTLLTIDGDHPADEVARAITAALATRARSSVRSRGRTRPARYRGPDAASTRPATIIAVPMPAASASARARSR